MSIHITRLFRRIKHSRTRAHRWIKGKSNRITYKHTK